MNRVLFRILLVVFLLTAFAPIKDAKTDSDYLLFLVVWFVVFWGTVRFILWYRDGTAGERSRE